MSFLRRSWSWLFLFLVPVVPLWRAIFLGEAIGPFDQIRSMAPWSAAKPVQPWDVLQADAALQFYGWRSLVFESWGKGHLPLWNPYELAGYPLLANSQSGALYPLHILAGLLHLPTALALTLLSWFHLGLAGAGVYALCKKLSATDLGAIVAGSSFSLSSFMLSWTGLPSVITTTAWIPWILVAIVGSFDQTTATQKKSLLGLALAVAMLMTAGHLQFAAYGLMAAVLFAIGWCLANKAKPARLVQIVVFCVLGGCLAAPQILPVLNYSQFSHRRNTPSQEGYNAYVAGSIKPFELATLGAPTALGSPRNPVDIGGGKTISEYWPGLVKQGANFAESAISLGPLVLGLLCLAPWKKRAIWPIAAIGLVAFLLALGTPLNAALYFGVPGWSSTGSPGRIVVLFVMASCILAGTAIEAQPEDSKKKLPLSAAGLVLLTAGLYFAAPSLTPAPTQVSPEALDTLRGVASSSSLPLMLISVVVGTIGLVLLTQSKFAKYRPALVAFPLLLAVASYASNIVMTGAPLAKVENAPTQDRIAIINSSWDLQTAAPALLPPNTATQSRIHELGGYDSLLHRDTVAMLADVNGTDAAPPANGNMMFIKPSADPAKLQEAGVSEVWSLKPLPQMGQATEQNGIYKYKLDGTRISATAGTATIVDETADSQTIEVTPGTKSVLIKDRWMPGWICTTTRKEVDQEGLWRKVDVPEGQTRLEFQYRPPGLRNGFLLMLASMICLLGYGGFSARGKTKSR